MVLNPFGILVLYIALSAAPESVTQFSVHFSDFDRMTLTKSEEGWWSRIDDTGKTLYYRSKKTKLLVKSEFHPQEETDLSAKFSVTGKEDWTQPVKIDSRSGTFISTEPGKNQMLIKVTESQKTVEIRIQWFFKDQP